MQLSAIVGLLVEKESDHSRVWVKNYVYLRIKLDNFCLFLKDNTIVQNAVASSHIIFSSPIVDLASVNYSAMSKDYFFLSFAWSSFVGKYSSTM